MALPFLPPELWWAILSWCDNQHEDFTPLVLLVALLMWRAGRALPQPLPAMDPHALLVHGHHAYCATRWGERSRSAFFRMGYLAAKFGHLPTLRRYPPLNVGHALQLAVQNGQLDVVRQLRAWEINRRGIVSREGVISDHPKIVRHLQEWSSPLNEEYMLIASRGGHLDIVQQCQEWGARNYNPALIQAARGGHLEVVRQLQAWGANDYEPATCAAATSGNLALVRQLQAGGARNYNYAMVCAAYQGHLSIVRQYLAWGAQDYNGAMYNAAAGGHLEVVRMLQLHGACDYSTARRFARTAGHIEVVKQLDAWQAADASTQTDNS